ncbi:MAG: hypothetical protein IPN38_17965, partial [Flavobacteriales bacterium]|nr:hypothetical protein [Flavobacteriales bacterium]
KADSSAEILACSKPGYDSETMLPTFFTNGNKADGLVIIANMGERQSWGQEVFRLKDNATEELGPRCRRARGGRRWTTAPTSSARASHRGPKCAEATAPSCSASTGDSLQLYDDQQGQMEVMLPAIAVRYRAGEGKATLIINGKPVAPAEAI